MGPEHQTITGRWRYDSSGSWYENDWSGTRKGLLKLQFEADPSVPCDWTGTWDFDWSNELQLTQSGSRVTGSYKRGGWNYTGYIDGTLSGTTLIGTWTEQDQTGRIEWAMQAGCNSFTGQYTHSMSATSGWYPLHTPAKRVGQPQPQPNDQPSPQPVNLSWAGTWNTDWGTMEITVSGTAATGIYTTNNGKLDGKINGRYFSGNWSRSPSYKAPKDAGSFLFVMSEDGNSFKGDWKYSDCSWMGPWDGDLKGTDESDEIIPPTNQKPVAQLTIVPQSPTTADTIIISSQSYDPDGDRLSYIWTIDGTQSSQYNNMVYCVIPGQAAGHHTAALTVTDNKGGSATAQTQYFVDSVQPQPLPPQPTPATNRPPTAYFTVTPQAPQTNSTIIATSQSSDPDGDTLSYAWSVDGIAMAQYTNQPYLIYQNPTVGMHTLGLQVADSQGATNSYQTQVSVTQAPQPSPGPQPGPSPQPVPGANNPPKAAFTFDPPQPEVGQTVQVISQSTDADGDKLSYSWYLDGDLLSQYTGQSQWKWKVPTGGHVMQLKVQDGKGGNDTISRKIKGADTDGSGKKIGPFSCFIATAAYGSPTAAELDMLRSFRDHVLIKSEAGRWAVDTYYRLSPPLAEYIAAHENMRTLVREGLLDPIVSLLKETRSMWQSN